MTSGIPAMHGPHHQAPEKTFPRVPVLIGTLALLSVLVLAIDERVPGIIGRQIGLLRSEIPAGALPRDGDTLHPKPYPVDDWVAGTTGTVGLKFTVSGPGLPDEFWLRFTEGSGRATAAVRVEWADERGLPVGVPFEKPFKDDC